MRTRKVPKPRRRRARVLRGDSWANTISGFGVLGKDKRLGASFSVCHVAPEDAEQVWRGDDIAARIVETPPDDMLREGYDICVYGDRERGEELEDLAEELDVNARLQRALEYERAYGGAGILLGVNGGKEDLSKPLKPESIRSIEHLTVYAPRELVPYRYYSDQNAPNYGEVAMYHLTPMVPGGTGRIRDVHESRIVKLGGIVTSRLSVLENSIPGWGDSIFNRVLQVINDFQANWAGASILMQDFAPGVLKIKGLAKILGMQKKGETSLQTRAQAIALARSVANTTILDAEEEFERKTVSVSGLAEMLAAFNLRLSAAAQMPVAMIMGDSPAGLNATGDSDHRWYYNRIKANQKSKLTPPLKRILKAIMQANGGAPDKWEIKFRPLWLLTELEAAQVRKTQAEADQIYITSQVLTSHEVALSRFGDGYSTETTIDVDVRDELMTAEDEKARLGEGAAEDKETERKAAEQAAKPPPAPVVVKPPPKAG